MALVELAKFYNSFEAGMVRARLDAEGIDSHLFDFNTSMEGGTGFLIPIRVMVLDEDLGEARRILAEPSDPIA